MSRLFQNKDCFHLILSQLDRKTLSALLLTCHEGRQQSLPYLVPGHQGDVLRTPLDAAPAHHHAQHRPLYTLSETPFTLPNTHHAPRRYTAIRLPIDHCPGNHVACLPIVDGSRSARCTRHCSKLGSHRRSTHGTDSAKPWGAKRRCDTFCPAGYPVADLIPLRVRRSGLPRPLLRQSGSHTSCAGM